MSRRQAEQLRILQPYEFEYQEERNDWGDELERQREEEEWKTLALQQLEGNSSPTSS